MKSASQHLMGKVVWVTGSSRGMGRVIAAHLASLGATMVVHGTKPFSTRDALNCSLADHSASISHESASSTSNFVNARQTCFALSRLTL